MGIVGTFNHNLSSSSYKIFWVDGDDWVSGWCKGHVSEGKEIRSGDKIRLVGKWKTDQRYPSFGKQFSFTSYTILAELVTFNDYEKMKSEKISGRILRFLNRDGSARIFVLETEERQQIRCKGRLVPRNEIFAGDCIMVSGEWKKDPQLGDDESSFHYGTYERFKKDSTEAIAISKKLDADENKKGENQFLFIHKFLKDIGQKKIFYEFHEPTYNTIAQHTKKQLYNRIIKSSPEEKDFYFLTAFLDRSVLDVSIQNFRNDNPDFKKQLIKCWSESPDKLEILTNRISKKVHKDKLIGEVVQDSKTFSFLLENVPGRTKTTQLLICLKIINEKYDRKEDLTFDYLCKNKRDEMLLRDYLLGIHGIGPKLANWSIANATGHWFVVDLHIEEVLKGVLKNTYKKGRIVKSEYADAIFEDWFGILDEVNRCYSLLSQDHFVRIFPDFDKADCGYLPFILTQYLWFYGKNYCQNKKDR